MSNSQNKSNKVSSDCADFMDSFRDLLLEKDYSQTELIARLQKNNDVIDSFTIKKLLQLEFSKEVQLVQNQIKVRLMGIIWPQVLLLSTEEFIKIKPSCYHFHAPLSYGINLISPYDGADLGKNTVFQVFTDSESICNSFKLKQLIKSGIDDQIFCLKKENDQIIQKIKTMPNLKSA